MTEVEDRIIFPYPGWIGGAIAARCGDDFSPGHWVCRIHGEQPDRAAAVSHRNHGVAWYCAGHDALEVP